MLRHDLKSTQSELQQAKQQLQAALVDLSGTQDKLGDAQVRSAVCVGGGGGGNCALGELGEHHLSSSSEGIEERIARLP